MFWPCDERRAGDGDAGTLERPSCHADDEDTLRCVSVPGAVDCILCGQCDAIIKTRRKRFRAVSEFIDGHRQDEDEARSRAKRCSASAADDICVASVQIKSDWRKDFACAAKCARGDEPRHIIRTTYHDEKHFGN